MRIPAVDPSSDRTVRTLLERVRGARWGRVSALYGVLAHAPDVASAWSDLGSAVRRRTSLDDRRRELAICLVARLCDQSFEWDNHAPLARAAGVSDAELDALLERDRCPTFTDGERRLLDLVEATVRNEVTDDLVADAGLTHRELVEVVATAAYYLATARFLDAFAIRAGAPEVPDPDEEPPR